MSTRDLDAAGITDSALRRSYELCRQLNAQHGKTYYLATLLLPPEKRPYVHALYGFARIPWIKKAQRLFTDDDIPGGAAKRHIYEMAREKLLGGGWCLLHHLVLSFWYVTAAPRPRPS